MSATAKLQAGAQIALSVVFLFGYFVMLALFLLGHIKTPPEWRDQLGILLGVLTSGVVIVLNFWFNRERPKEAPVNEN